jgi:glutamate synthase (NADPH/NADH) small chain
MEELGKVHGKVQEPQERVKNFKEVELGYTDEEALAEASRCLHCPKPRCMEGCPVSIAIPEFIQCIKDGNLEEAYKVISKSSSLPAVCGRVCPQEKQCESMCVRGLKGEAISIGSLERYVADQAIKNNYAAAKVEEKNGKRVAIVGAGPAGLTCAGDLAKAGYEVTIYEILHKAGGVLTYGIPEFRLPKSIVEKEVDSLKKLGVNVLCDVPIGNAITLEELEKEYDAVFLGTGAGLPKFMGIPGEDANQVFSANEILTRINLMKAYKDHSDTPVNHSKKVAVIGGGNVAMDAARSAKRLGGDVTIVYRRTKAELPARAEEVEHAIEEGIKFAFLTNPTKINGDENGNVKSITCIKMELGEPDASGRRRPVEVEGSEFDIDVDEVIMSLGTSPNPLIKSTTSGLDTQRWGGIIADEETGKTSRDHVYAGGDAVTGAATVILAMGAGKKAAAAIAKELLK